MLLLLASAVADGTVHIPLTDWESLLDAAAAADDRPTPPVAVLQADRRIDGSFRRGVFTGTLVTRVRVPVADEPLRVPVLDSGASIARVELDGRVTSLLPEGDSYTVGIETPGEHTVRVEFFVGRPDDRFARRLQLRLPAGGPTALSLWVPETDIAADLAEGAVTALRAQDGGTRVEGQLDGRGSLDLSWKGAHTESTVPVKSESHATTLYTLGDALVRGTTVVDTTVLEGETDRLTLALPPGVQVLDVQGDAVLQWRPEAGSLVVLLRYLVSDRTRVTVSFQLPVEPDAPVNLQMPIPEGLTTGAIGVQGPAGVHAEVTTSSGTSPLRDLPADLAALTPNPLLLGFETTGAPSVTLAVTRQAEIELSATVADELEAATVLIEDGAEITKLQLHVRNRTKQYLGLRLPDGAVLTQARIDGRPLRPATGADGGLLLPLIQSEAVDAGGQTYLVQAGDTLGGIADRFYSDPSQWRQVMDANPDLLPSVDALTAGQVLRIPIGASTARESRFVIDLVWTRATPALGPIGRRDLRLPTLDAEVGSVEWHVLLPEDLAPLDFSGNLRAYSHVRYDHLRRLRQFLDLAWRVDDAWAGDSYENILSRRKAIFASENEQDRHAQEVVGDIPMVGERYRFKRILPGREVPELTVTWIAGWMVPLARIAAALVATALTLRGRRALPGFLGLLLVAWFVDGVHRSVLMGVDLGLVLLITRRSWPGPVTLPTAAQLLDGWTWRSVRRGAALAGGLLVLLAAPMLWSTGLLLALAAKVRRAA